MFFGGFWWFVVIASSWWWRIFMTGHAEQTIEWSFWEMRSDPNTNNQRQFSALRVNRHFSSSLRNFVLSFAVRAMSWNFVYAEPSTSPRDVTPAAVDKQPTSVSLHWQPPRQANGQLTGQCIHCILVRWLPMFEVIAFLHSFMYSPGTSTVVTFSGCLYRSGAQTPAHGPNLAHDKSPSGLQSPTGKFKFRSEQGQETSRTFPTFQSQLKSKLLSP